MSTRIYIVLNGDDKPRLVRARSQAEAVRHTVKHYVVAAASAEEVAAAYEAGAKVETARDEPEQGALL